jgi:hypothetical protein
MVAQRQQVEVEVKISEGAPIKVEGKVDLGPLGQAIVSGAGKASLSATYSRGQAVATPTGGVTP